MSSFREYLKEIKKLDQREARDEAFPSRSESSHFSPSGTMERVDGAFCQDAFLLRNWLAENHLGLSQEIQALERKIQSALLQGADPRTLEGFTSRWASLHEKAIELLGATGKW